MEEKTITITMKEYGKLKFDSDFLNCLKCAGVDNWGGFSDAVEMLDQEQNESEE